MYDFAGCQLDYVRNATNPLENNDFSYDKATLDLFMTYYGYNPLDLPYPSAYDRTREGYVPGDSGAKWENWQAFREELITSMVARLAIAMKEKKARCLYQLRFCRRELGRWHYTAGLPQSAELARMGTKTSGGRSFATGVPE